MDLYYALLSPPCRAAMMTAKAVGVELNLKEISLNNKDHLKPEFLKINPQHTIPTLVDDGFALWESRAIMIYLVEKYGKTDSLYPKCPKSRAIINQRLYFDAAMFERSNEYIIPQFNTKAPADPEKFKKMEDAVSFLEIFLENQQYVAGDTLTIADITLFVTVSTYELCKIDISKYPNVDKWYKLCKEVMPGVEINEKGLLVEYENYFKDLNL